MSPTETPSVRHSTISYLALRKWLGILGLSLPLLIWIVNGFALKSSISHFYYSPASVIFTGFLITFGIFLIFYPGRIDHDVKVSDNWITTIGGIGAILTALIPTAFCSGYDEPIKITDELSGFCGGTGLTIHYVHNNSTLGTIHLLCAATFLILMGFMSYWRFTKGNTTDGMKKFYRFCAFMVWTPLVILAIEFAFHIYWTVYDVFIMECVALFFFGLAWLVKGKTLKRFGIG